MLESTLPAGGGGGGGGGEGGGGGGGGGGGLSQLGHAGELAVWGGTTVDPCATLGVG